MEQISVISGWKQHQKYLQGFPLCLWKDVHIVDRRGAVWEDISYTWRGKKGGEPHEAVTAVNASVRLCVVRPVTLRRGCSAAVGRCAAGCGCCRARCCSGGAAQPKFPLSFEAQFFVLVMLGTPASCVGHLPDTGSAHGAYGRKCFDDV